MSKRGCGGLGWHLTGHPGRRPACIRCSRPIVYGDRCPPCQQELRQRRKRKPR